MSSFLYMDKESIIRSTNSLYHILNGLTAKQVPIGIFLSPFQLCQKYLKPISRKVFPVHSIVTAMKSNTMIPDFCRNVDGTIKMCILLIIIQSVLVGHAYLHSGNPFP